MLSKRIGRGRVAVSATMSQSFLRKGSKQSKISVKRHYRVGTSPYDTVKSSSHARSKSTMLLSTSKHVSARIMDRKNSLLRKEYETLIQGYTKDQRHDLSQVQREIGWEDMKELGYQWAAQLDLDGEDSDDDWTDETVGHFYALSVSVPRQHPDTQSWANRLARERLLWESLMPQLCEAFLAFGCTGPPQVDSPIATSSSSPLVSVLCISLTEKSVRTFCSGTADESTATTLMRNGYIPPTPFSPSCAIHIDVLRYCAALRRHASSISLQGIAASICEIHNTTYVRHFRTQLSAALDVYLAVLRMVDLKVARVLDREDSDWRLANACAACTYRLQDEAPLKYSILLTCDGNDSLKRVANASTVDRRVLNDNYYLSSDYVDAFENEVPGKNKKKSLIAQQSLPHSFTSSVLDSTNASQNINRSNTVSLESREIDLESNSENVEDHNVGTDELQSSVAEEVTEDCETETTKCESRWKNASADSTGKKVVVFDETGIFAVSCRHGSVMLIEDMRHSGELSKYGLAAVDKLSRTFGKNILIGYDIGCTFRGTAERSPLVGPLVRDNNVSFCVGSFHGYAHNRKCQLRNHPLNIEGAGTESFEECETLFSSSNSAALTTRHASPFHRRQHIVLHMGGWDHGRRCAIGSVLKSKYAHALRILDTLPAEIARLSPNKSDDDWNAMFLAERNYFDSLKAPSLENSFAMHYVERLKILAEKQAAFDKAYSVTMAYTVPSQIDYYRNHPSIQNTDKEDKYQNMFAANTRKLEAQRRAATEQLHVIQTEVALLEKERGISPRWTPEFPEWKSALEREAQEEYHLALRNLESLVVQRIGELDKANLAGTGYKARVQMAKGIKRRERAVHSALARYNTAATSVGRPTILFKELTDYAYLANFDFLKFSEHGAQEAEWSRPVNRRCVEAWQKIQRAKEEIIRLNIEIRRVLTHIRDEEDFLANRYDTIKHSEPNLAHALLGRMELTVRVNQRIRRDIIALSKMDGFAGDLGFGTAVTPVSSGSEGASPCNNTADSRLRLADELGDIDQVETAEPTEVIETEPTDEVRQEMVAIEESCKVM